VIRRVLAVVAVIAAVLAALALFRPGTPPIAEQDPGCRPSSRTG
jgi:hypothetical protein